MVNEIKRDLNRAIYSLPFLWSSLAMVIAIAMGAGLKMLFPGEIGPGVVNGYHSQLILAGLSSKILLMVVPIICTLPYTGGFLDEYQSGFIKPYLIRCHKSGYIRGKVLGPGISGGLALSLGIFISYLLASLIYKPLELADPMALSSVHVVVSKMLVFFFCGCLWASVGSLLANITLSKYMAYGAPFVIYYVLIILSDRYFPSLYVLNPEEWLTPENPWVGGDWGIMLLIVLFTVIIMMINDLVIERRIGD